MYYTFSCTDITIWCLPVGGRRRSLSSPMHGPACTAFLSSSSHGRVGKEGRKVQGRPLYTLHHMQDQTIGWPNVTVFLDWYPLTWLLLIQSSNNQWLSKHYSAPSHIWTSWSSLHISSDFIAHPSTQCVGQCGIRGKKKTKFDAVIENLVGCIWIERVWLHFHSWVSWMLLGEVSKPSPNFPTLCTLGVIFHL